MPAGVAVAGAAAAIYGHRQQGRAARQAAKYTEAAGSQVMRQENDAETRRREEYDRTEVEDRRRWDAEQAQLAEDRRIAEEERQRTHDREAEDRRLEAEDRRIAEEERQRNLAIWNEREARMAPYRQAGAGALAELSRLAGQPGTPSGGTAGPRPMPAGWTPASSPTPAPSAPVSDLPTTTSHSLESYGESLPITRDPSVARELGDTTDLSSVEPANGSLASMRHPTEDVSYILDNPSAVSPEAYRRLVQSQGEANPDALPLSMMRQPHIWARRPRRPVPRSEVRA